MALKAKAQQDCFLCDQVIEVGDLINLADGIGWHHASCPPPAEMRDVAQIEDAWAGCESIDDHPCKQGWLKGHVGAHPVLWCCACHKQFRSDGRKLTPWPDEPMVFPERPEAEEFTMAADDPWAEIARP